MFLKLTVSLLALICLANCQSTTGSRSDITESEFLQSPLRSANPLIDTSQDYVRDSDATIKNAGVVGYSYTVGQKKFSSTLTGYSDLNFTKNLPAPTKVNGTAKFSGLYKAGLIKEIKPADGRISASLVEFTGRMTLDADFAQKTLKGTSDDKKLVVDGRFSGQDISGKVQFRKTNGKLKGQISDNITVGAFHGHNNQNVYAGGFLLQ